MVLVSVQELMFDMRCEDVNGEKTIENVLHYNNQYNINLPKQIKQ